MQIPLFFFTSYGHRTSKHAYFLKSFFLLYNITKKVDLKLCLLKSIFAPYSQFLNVLLSGSKKMHIRFYICTPSYNYIMIPKQQPLPLPLFNCNFVTSSIFLQIFLPETYTEGGEGTSKQWYVWPVTICQLVTKGLHKWILISRRLKHHHTQRLIFPLVNGHMNYATYSYNHFLDTIQDDKDKILRGQKIYL